jgi:lysozyme
MKKCLSTKFWTPLVGCLLAGVVMTVSCCGKNGKSEVVTPNDSIVLGLDVSQYQGQIDWQNLSLHSNCVSVEEPEGDYPEGNLPVRFVFIRATKSDCFVDTCFQRNFDNAKQQGIARGAYHFLVDSVPGAKQAAHFLSVAKLEKGDLPPVLDIEKDSQNGNTITVPVEEWRHIAKEWLDVVEKHLGVKPIIYTDLDGYKNWIKDDDVLREHDLWIAAPHKNRDSLPNNWIFWQFSQKGHAIGITENVVDINLFHGTLEDLKQYISEKGIAK